MFSAPKSVKGVFEKMTSDLQHIIDVRSKTAAHLENQITHAQQQLETEQKEVELARQAVRSFEQLFKGDK